MTLALINTLEYVKILTQVGFSQREAEGLNKAQMMATQAILSQVATHEDLKDLRSEMQSELKDLRTEMQSEFKDLRSEMQSEFKNVRAEMKALAHELRAETKALAHELRAEIKAVEHRLDKKIDALKPFIYRVMITIMLTNLTVIGLGMGALALFLRPY